MALFPVQLFVDHTALLIPPTLGNGVHVQLATVSSTVFQYETLRSFSQVCYPSLIYFVFIRIGRSSKCLGSSRVLINIYSFLLATCLFPCSLSSSILVHPSISSSRSKHEASCSNLFQGRGSFISWSCQASDGGYHSAYWFCLNRKPLEDDVLFCSSLSILALSC